MSKVNLLINELVIFQEIYLDNYNEDQPYLIFDN
jgi:hypothetical protein